MERMHVCIYSQLRLIRHHQNSGKLSELSELDWSAELTVLFNKGNQWSVSREIVRIKHSAELSGWPIKRSQLTAFFDTHLLHKTGVCNIFDNSFSRIILRHIELENLMKKIYYAWLIDLLIATSKVWPLSSFVNCTWFLCMILHFDPGVKRIFPFKSWLELLPILSMTPTLLSFASTAIYYASISNTND